MMEYPDNLTVPCMDDADSMATFTVNTGRNSDQPCITVDGLDLGDSTVVNMSIQNARVLLAWLQHHLAKFP